MAQFEVYSNPDSRARRIIPYLLAVQSDLLRDLSSCTVVPLVDAAHFGPSLTRLNPVFTVERNRVVMSTAEMAAVPRRILRQVVGSLRAERDTIVAAIDFLILGF
jgi:toxin CcdB